MKYCVKNDLSLFEFHDSEFCFVSFDGKDLVVSVSMLNIHMHTPQNPSEHDMEIVSAQITFENVHRATYEPGRTWKMGEDGMSYPIGPRIVYTEQEAMDRIVEELENDFTVYGLETEEGHRCSMHGWGIENYIVIEFDYDGVAVCWDEYEKKAWYERTKQYRYDATLQTPQGEETVQLRILCHEDGGYYQGVWVEPPIATVGCTYDGEEYWGRGEDDYLWIKAFADLQKKLPEGVTIKCCLTCRHGNLCPVGNPPNEVFCTKDVLITQKSDLYFYTEDDIEREKRSRQSCTLCEDYQPQTDDYYTYNDFLYHLKET